MNTIDFRVGEVQDLRDDPRSMSGLAGVQIPVTAEFEGKFYCLMAQNDFEGLQYFARDAGELTELQAAMGVDREEFDEVVDDALIAAQEKFDSWLAENVGESC